MQLIKDKFNQRVDPKYRNGQKEHGGDLFRKRNMLGFSIDEVIDLCTYLFTLEGQFDAFMVQIKGFVAAGILDPDVAEQLVKCFGELDE